MTSTASFNPREALKKVVDALATLLSSVAGRAALKRVLGCDNLHAMPPLPTSPALSTLAKPARMR